jgi:anion-transporting  ArsA/GET3 family ATPase
VRVAPKTFVCVGGGGVGKTTTSAALAVALASRGRRVLLVTIDPARRLADAIGVPLGNEVQAVDHGSLQLEKGQLLALMPEPRAAMRCLVDDLFRYQPEALARLLDNAVYKALEDAVPGIHELAAMNLVGRALEERAIDTLVIDTAPSRNAIDFVDYPRRLAELLGGRVVAWLASVARRGKTSRQQASNRVERLLVKAMGPAIFDAAELFSEMARILPRFVELNALLAELLLGAKTDYLLVAAPSRGGREDATYLYRQLKRLGQRPRALLLNGVGGDMPPWVKEVLASGDSTDAMRSAVAGLEAARQARNSAADEAEKSFQALASNLRTIRLEHRHDIEPTQIVASLASSLIPKLTLLSD